MKQLGRLESVWRYPVKSMHGERVEEVFVSFAGLMGDRVYAFSSASAAAEFPWHTCREQENLVLHRAAFRSMEATVKPVAVQAALEQAVALNPTYPPDDLFQVEVETPSGQTIDVRDPSLIDSLQESSEAELTLRFSQRSMTDCRPISIFSNQTLGKLEEEVGFSLDRRRFRANFYVDWDSGVAFAENDLVGKRVQVGNRIELMIIERDPRCKVITIDPETADTEPRILRHVTREHGGCAGVYGAVLKEGVVQEGDIISLCE